MSLQLRRVGSLSLLAGSLALAGWGASGAWKAFRQPLRAFDFYQFWVVGQAAGSVPPEAIYSPDGRRTLGAYFLRVANEPGHSRAQRQVAYGRRVLETYSTPLLYAAFGAASSGDYERDYSRFHALNLLATCAALLLLCRLFGYGPAFALFAVGAVLLVYSPYGSDALLGNVNALQLFGLSLFLALRRLRGTKLRDALAGAVLAALLLFKPNLAPVALLVVAGWAAARGLRATAPALAGLAAGGALGLAAGALRFGSGRIWLLWARALSSLSEELTLPIASGNFALAQFLDEKLGLKAVPVLPLALLGCAVLVVIASARRAPADAFGHDARAVVLGIAVMLLGSSLAWQHYFLLAVPGLLWIARPGARAPWVGRAVAAAAFAACTFPVLRSVESTAPVLLLPLFAGGTVAAALLCGYEALARTAPVPDSTPTTTQA